MDQNLWYVIIPAVAGVLAYLLKGKFPQPTPNQPSPSLTPSPIPDGPDPAKNPLAYLLWMLLHQWMQPPKPPVQLQSPAYQQLGAGDALAESTLVGLIRADPDRHERIVKLLGK